jgi:chromosome segregation ATPase
MLSEAKSESFDSIRLQQDLQTLEGELKTMQELNSLRILQIAKKDLEIEKIRGTMSNLREEMQKTVRELNMEFEKVKLEKICLADQINTKKDQMVSLKNSLQFSESTVRELASEIDNLKRQKTRFEFEGKKTEDALRASLVEIESHMSDRETQVNNLKGELEEFMKSKEESEKASADVLEKIKLEWTFEKSVKNDLQNDIKKVSSDFETTLKNQEDLYKTNLANLEMQAKNSQDDYQFTLKNLNAFELKSANLEKQLTILTEKHELAVKTFAKDNEMTFNDLEHLKKITESWKSKEDAFHVEISNLKCQLCEKDEEIVALTSAHQKALDETRSEFDKISLDFSHANSKISSLGHELGKAKELKESSSKKLEAEVNELKEALDFNINSNDSNILQLEAEVQELKTTQELNTNSRILELEATVAKSEKIAEKLMIQKEKAKSQKEKALAHVKKVDDENVKNFDKSQERKAEIEKLSILINEQNVAIKKSSAEKASLENTLLRSENGLNTTLAKMQTYKKQKDLALLEKSEALKKLDEIQIENLDLTRRHEKIELENRTLVIEKEKIGSELVSKDRTIRELQAYQRETELTITDATITDKLLQDDFVSVNFGYF